MLLLPKNILVLGKRQLWVSLADVTLIVGVHKCLLNFWFKRVEDCYIRHCLNILEGSHIWIMVHINRNDIFLRFCKIGCGFMMRDGSFVDKYNLTALLY